MGNKELWMPTHISEDYLVSSLGRVYSLKSNKHLSIVNISNGYKGVMIASPYKRVWPVHRLVAFAFIPNPENKPQVNHKNCDKTDNKLDNLEWVTPSENLRHAYKHGLISKKGEKHHFHKLKDDDIREIRMLLNGNLTQLEIGSLFNVGQDVISRIKNKKVWAHV